MPMRNNDINIVKLQNPRGIVRADGSLALKVGGVDFVDGLTPEQLAVLQHQVLSLGAFAHAQLEAHPREAEAFIARLLAKAPEPSSAAEAVAVICNRENGSIALGFQFDTLMPFAVRLDRMRAIEIAARINGCSRLFN